MRKPPIRHGVVALTTLVLPFLLCCASEPPTYSALADSQIERLKKEVEHTRQLVENGTLARVKLKEAQEALADAEDEGILARTLYGSIPMEMFTEAQASEMLAAAQRRVDRQQAVTKERKTMLDSGVISQAEFETVWAALDTRRQVLVLAQNRINLLEEIRRMAETERKAELALASAPATLKSSMIRYDGNGAFTLADVPAIEGQFEKRFHRSLPISALGQTILHQSLGLDHRNRVDVALLPNSPEGLWLRALLERLRVPYLAFTNAVSGAATAPHIHIGVGSTRIRPNS